MLSNVWTIPFLVLLSVVEGTESADHSDSTTTPSYQGLFLGWAQINFRDLSVNRSETYIHWGGLLAGGRCT